MLFQSSTCSLPQLTCSSPQSCDQRKLAGWVFGGRCSSLERTVYGKLLAGGPSYQIKKRGHGPALAISVPSVQAGPSKDDGAWEARVEIFTAGHGIVSLRGFTVGILT